MINYKLIKSNVCYTPLRKGSLKVILIALSTMAIKLYNNNCNSHIPLNIIKIHKRFIWYTETISSQHNSDSHNNNLNNLDLSINTDFMTKRNKYIT